MDEYYQDLALGIVFRCMECGRRVEPFELHCPECYLDGLHLRYQDYEEEVITSYAPSVTEQEN